ncbi:MAG: dihydrolipoyl dehydrogenase [Candidatus Lambdaproteobacteria bacterium RIFOXYD2_FULL_50_16]|uniref:Dihydrolipoyl dehydrogenase n=1 Tax=Candidatus Lambdaproteobacteria bacterium RIFOXYD2_FULL_50_16 TaxID=1817772 RepID=A0A1F6G5A8_9PROT|nr:MAG: dihydrolipoyl dehydrogenase [Candidatus Lambdaproteobacteria bacterium RIFOXYD2_FULL_50_16]
MDFDLLIIGAGPGGYVAAIRAAQLGLKTGLIEKGQPGGTCLNVGCIPSKALLEKSWAYAEACKLAPDLAPDWAGIQAHRAQVIIQQHQGLHYLFKKNGIEYLSGKAEILGPERVAVGGEEHRARNILIATGSRPLSLSHLKPDGTRILTSDELLSLETLPKSLLVVGGGVIGLELGSVFTRMGTQVTVVELTDRVLPEMDLDISKEMTRCLKKQGLNFKLNHRLEALENRGDHVWARMSDKKGTDQELTADLALLALGRRPYTEGLGLETVGITLDSRGFIPVDTHYQAGPGIFAIGDVIGGAMLAHKASEEGVHCVEKMAGALVQESPLPSAVYTHPEAASVGLTEQALAAKETPYLVGRFNFRPLGRAQAAGQLDGFAKVLCAPDSGKILGVHLCGERASDLIAIGALALEQGLTAETWGRQLVGHPSFAEALKEAALDAWGHRAIHL